MPAGICGDRPVLVLFDEIPLQFVSPLNVGVMMKKRPAWRERKTDKRRMQACVVVLQGMPRLEQHRDKRIKNQPGQGRCIGYNVLKGGNVRSHAGGHMSFIDKALQRVSEQQWIQKGVSPLAQEAAFFGHFTGAEPG